MPYDYCRRCMNRMCWKAKRSLISDFPLYPYTTCISTQQTSFYSHIFLQIPPQYIHIEMVVLKNNIPEVPVCFCRVTVVLLDGLIIRQVGPPVELSDLPFVRHLKVHFKAALWEHIGHNTQMSIEEWLTFPHDAVSLITHHHHVCSVPWRSTSISQFYLKDTNKKCTFKFLLRFLF